MSLITSKIIKAAVIVIKIICYALWSILFFSSLGSVFSGYFSFSGLLALLFGLGLLPITYSHIKTTLIQKNWKPDFLKFTLPYFLIVLSGFIISYSNTKTHVVSVINEPISLFVEYNINTPITESDKLGIKITHKNASTITINNVTIPLTETPISYEYPLILGENNIIITGSNSDEKKEIKKTITRMTAEETSAKKAEEEKKKNDKIATKKEELTADTISLLTKKINEIEKFDSTGYLSDPLSVIVITDLFKEYANVANSYTASGGDPRVIERAVQLKSELSLLQTKEFPKLRVAYAKLIKESLSGDNIDVKITGNNSATIEFIGSVFTSNKIKLKTYATISENLKILRFNGTNFKLNTYDENYTHWDIDSLGDNIIDS